MWRSFAWYFLKRQCLLDYRKIGIGICTGVALSPDGRRLAVASANASRLAGVMWDTATAAEVFSFARRKRSYKSDPRGMATSAEHGSRSAPTTPASYLPIQATLSRAGTRTRAREKAVFRGHTNRVFGVAFRPDGKTVASSSDDRTIRLWEAATGKEISSFPASTRELVFICRRPTPGFGYEERRFDPVMGSDSSQRNWPNSGRPRGDRVQSGRPAHRGWCWECHQDMGRRTPPGDRHAWSAWICNRVPGVQPGWPPGRLRRLGDDHWRLGYRACAPGLYPSWN